MGARLLFGAVFVLGFMAAIQPACSQVAPRTEVDSTRALVENQSDTAAAPPRYAAPVIPHFDQGFATDDEVRNAVGTPTYSLETQCNQDHNEYDFHDNRDVAAKLERMPADFERRGSIIDSVLRAAAMFAWQACPHPFVVLGDVRNDFHYEIRTVSIYAPDGTLAVKARLGGNGMDLTGDQPLGSSRDGYVWRDYFNGIEAARVAAAQLQQQMADAEAQRNRAAQAKVYAERSSASFWGNVRVLALVVALVWLFIKRETIARWYYGLKPHPATGVVERALNYGAPIDGDLYERVVRPIPGGRIENEVRTRQANDLTRRLRQHEAVLRSEETRRIEEERKRAAQENAFSRAHIELLNAGVDHEIAAARVDELRRITRKS